MTSKDPRNQVKAKYDILGFKTVFFVPGYLLKLDGSMDLHARRMKWSFKRGGLNNHLLRQPGSASLHTPQASSYQSVVLRTREPETVEWRPGIWILTSPPDDPDACSSLATAVIGHTAQ